MTDWKRDTLKLMVLALLVSACGATVSPTANPASTEVLATDTLIVSSTIVPTTAPLSTATVPATATTSHAPTKTFLSTPTVLSPSPTALPSVTSTTVFYSGPGCLHPPDDYGRVEINGETLNARTLWMLQQAVTLYDGPGDLLRVTQGSYTTNEATSFGTHAGGGAVDISIRNPANPSKVLWNETDAMVLALRRAGFAAWYRAPGDLGPGSPAHIHAIAIGDQELSPEAIEQLIGPSGYFQGLDGLPSEYGGPHLDPHGGPVICPWMIEIGYEVLKK